MFCTNCGKQISEISKFCAYCGATVPIKKTQLKEIQLIFNRPKKFFACLAPMRVYIDKKLVLELKNGKSGKVIVEPGKHKILLEMWSTKGEEEFEFSKEYSKVNLDISLKMGLWNNKLNISNIRNEK